ncbi:NADP-dependent oxidoreductase [Streptomyces phyllanthi]
MTEVDTPRPEAGELLVKVAAASVNGIDVATAAGYLHGMMEHRFPLVLGKDFAGTVEAFGGGVDGFAVGDAVFGVVMKPFLGAGSLAEYVTVPAGHGVAPLPAGLAVADAGALGLAGATAVDSLDAVARGEGETVLISGAGGGVGSLAVQLAAARGARVIATARPGAQTDFVTGLTGTDAEVHVVDSGLTQDAVKDPDVTVHPIMADPNASTLTALAEQVASGELRVPVTATYSLERAAEAFTAFSSGTPGKVAVACS